MAAFRERAHDPDALDDVLRDDTLLLVFSHLAIGPLAACRLACRRWRRLAAETVGGWAKAKAEPRSAAFLCTEPTRSETRRLCCEFVRGLAFRPNLGIVTLSSAFSAKHREELVRAIGAELPPELILVGTSCTGAIGPRGSDGKLVERESGASVSLHVQWLPETSVHMFAMQATGRPIVDAEPAMRSTRSGNSEETASFFDQWMGQIHSEDTGATGGGGLLLFSASPRDEDVQRALEYVEGYNLPVCGGRASGPSPRVYLYSMARGGLLSAGARTHTVFVCVRSAVCTMRTCVVCEEWGAGAAAQAQAMRQFVRSAPCGHFAHRLLSHGPPLEAVHAAFIVSCVGRGREFHGGDADCDSASLLAELSGIGQQLPTVSGFFSLGEIGPSGQAEPLSHQFACALVLFGKPARETDAERACRFQSACGFRACVCHSQSAGPFDDEYMAENVPFQAPPQGAAEPE